MGLTSSTMCSTASSRRRPKSEEDGSFLSATSSRKKETTLNGNSRRRRQSDASHSGSLLSSSQRSHVYVNSGDASSTMNNSISQRKVDRSMYNNNGHHNQIDNNNNSDSTAVSTTTESILHKYSINNNRNTSSDNDDNFFDEYDVRQEGGDKVPKLMSEQEKTKKNYSYTVLPQQQQQQASDNMSIDTETTYSDTAFFQDKGGKAAVLNNSLQENQYKFASRSKRLQEQLRLEQQQRKQPPNIYHNKKNHDDKDDEEEDDEIDNNEYILRQFEDRTVYSGSGVNSGDRQREREERRKRRKELEAPKSYDFLYDCDTGLPYGLQAKQRVVIIKNMKLSPEKKRTGNYDEENDSVDNYSDVSSLSGGELFANMERNVDEQDKTSTLANQLISPLQQQVAAITEEAEESSLLGMPSSIDMGGGDDDLTDEDQEGEEEDLIEKGENVGNEVADETTPTVLNGDSSSPSTAAEAGAAATSLVQESAEKYPLVGQSTSEGSGELSKGDNENNPQAISTVDKTVSLVDATKTAAATTTTQQRRTNQGNEMPAGQNTNSSICSADGPATSKPLSPNAGVYIERNDCSENKANNTVDNNQQEDIILPIIPSSTDLSPNEMYNNLLLFETKRRETHKRMIETYLSKIRNEQQFSFRCIEGIEHLTYYDFSNSKVPSFKKDLQASVAAANKKLSSICKKLDKLENVAINCFDRYSMVAITVFPNNQSMSPIKPNLSEIPGENNEDLWILETRYRIIVAYHQAMWNNHSRQFQRLLGEIRKAESVRRTSLCSFVAEYKSKYDNTALDSDLHDLLNRVQAKQQECESPMKDVKKKKVCVNMKSPLLNNMVVYAKLAERQENGGLQWNKCLLVATTSKLLHIFDFPPSVDVDLSCEPDDAFLSLAPTFKEFKGKGEAIAKDFLAIWDFLTPSETLTVDNCSAIQRAERREVRIIERRPPKGFVKRVPRNYSLVLRTKSKLESDGLVAAFY